MDYVDEILQLRKEIKEHIKVIDAQREILSELRVENFRYKTALQRIVDYSDFADDEYSDTVAAKALNPNPPHTEPKKGRAAKSVKVK